MEVILHQGPGKTTNIPSIKVEANPFKKDIPIVVV
jgi:hypothetical protein